MAITYQAPLNWQLTQNPPQFADIPADVEAYIKQLHISVLLMQQQIALQSGALAVLFSETVVYGAMVQLYSAAGVLTARNANSSNTGSSAAVQPIHCFCNMPAGVSAGNAGFVQFTGVAQGLSGLTIGSPYWLKAANGQVQTAPDTTAGHIEQFAGIALSSTTLAFKAASWIQH